MIVDEIKKEICELIKNCKTGAEILGTLEAINSAGLSRRKVQLTFLSLP
ncbi:unnamed protein product [marine sediment metagenome]|uniref:Uncharacterized protein n=1 Tax=marine sediment metagenome TaxID=412755 RepID=X1HB66_9ZZZZ